MRILMLHNYYQRPGGEDVVFESEAELLTSQGHIVQREEFRNESIPDERTILASGRLAVSAIMSLPSFRRVRAAIRTFQPDIVHAHNTFPLISAAGIYACQRENVPLVQTLHNYRHLCSGGMLFRDGRECRKCVGRRLSWPGIVHGCYRRSHLMSATMTGIQLAHRVTRKGARGNTISIVPSEAARREFIAGGFSADSLRVKPNFVPNDPGPGCHEGDYALYVGRLSEEKGIANLINAWDRLPSTIPLKVVGDGPLRDLVAGAAEANPAIEWLGHRPKSDVIRHLGEASVLIFPSEWSETFGLTIIEAYARATPVIASRLGAPAEIVRDHHTGLHFSAGDPADLAAKVRYLFATPGMIKQFGLAARDEFRSRYTAEANYEMLMSVYAEAQARRASTNVITTGNLAR